MAYLITEYLLSLLSMDMDLLHFSLTLAMAIKAEKIIGAIQWT